MNPRGIFKLFKNAYVGSALHSTCTNSGASDFFKIRWVAILWKAVSEDNTLVLSSDTRIISNLEQGRDKHEISKELALGANLRGCHQETPKSTYVIF